jgi:hypothetical protein
MFIQGTQSRAVRVEAKASGQRSRRCVWRVLEETEIYWGSVYSTAFQTKEEEVGLPLSRKDFLKVFSFTDKSEWLGELKK